MATVDEAQTDSLCSRLGLVRSTTQRPDRPVTQEDEYDEIAVRELLEVNLHLSASETTLNDGLFSFISTYASINIVCNEIFATTWKKFQDGKLSWEDGPAHASIQGNSRDQPTPYVFKCTKTLGCIYSTLLKTRLTNHQDICNEEVVSKV